MGNPTNITLFGLGPRVGNRSGITGPALFRLNASAKAAALVLGDKGRKIRHLTAEFIQAARTNNAAKALVAREKLARLLAGLSAQEIRAIHDRARHRGLSPYSAMNPFAALDPGALRGILARRSEKELEPSEDRQIVEGNDHQKARQALGRISTAAAFGNSTSFNELKAIAAGSSYMASAARVIVERWEEWHLLAAIDDRLTLARAISQITMAEYTRAVTNLLAGNSQKELGQHLMDFAHALDTLAGAIDKTKANRIVGWRDNREAQIAFHDGVDRILGMLINAGNAMTQREISVAQHPLKILFGTPQQKGLLGDVYQVLSKNALSLIILGVGIDIDIPEGVAPAQEDHRKKLKAVLAELIDNALKYLDGSKPNPFIRIAWDPVHRILIVSDNGIGIQEPEKIWTEGFREKRNRASGTGLGLALVRQRINEMGWSISVASTPGVGTTFKLHPPVEGMLDLTTSDAAAGRSKTWKIKEARTLIEFLDATAFEPKREGLPDLAPEVFQARVIEHRSVLEQLGFKVRETGILEIGTPEEFLERLRSVGGKDLQTDGAAPIGYLQYVLPDGTHTSVFASVDVIEIGDLKSSRVGKRGTVHLVFDPQGQIRNATVHIALETSHREKMPAGEVLGKILGVHTLVAPVGDRTETLFSFVLEPSTPN